MKPLWLTLNLILFATAFAHLGHRAQHTDLGTVVGAAVSLFFGAILRGGRGTRPLARAAAWAPLTAPYNGRLRVSGQRTWRR